MSDLTIERTWVPRYSNSLPTVGDVGPADRPTPLPADDEIAAAFVRLSKTMSWS